MKLDFALVCATHCELETLIGDGRFRSDLYYRISHHSVHIPALRDQGDLPALVQTLWARMGDGRRLSVDALMALSSYDWPGNLRQLVACLRTVVALSEPDTVIGTSALPAYLRGIPARAVAAAATPIAADEHLDAQTLAAMRAAVDACHGNIALAARKLGISRSTLYRRLDSDARSASRLPKTPLR